MAFTFNDKTSYLAYRSDWKRCFLDHLKAVRAAKLAIREANRAYSKDSTHIGGIWGAYRDLRAAHEDTVKLQVELDNARREAGRQMALNTPANSRDTAP